MKRHLGILVLSLSILVGCSNRSTPVAVEPATQSQADTDDSYDYNYSTAQNSNSNLWDTSTQYDAPAVSPTPTPSPTPVAYPNYVPPQWACLNGNSGYQYPTPSSTPANPNNPPWYSSGSGSASLPTSCLDSSWGGFFGEDMLFDAGIGSFGAMQTCYETVMGKGPQFCSAGYPADMVFQMSQMALTRCFRHILRTQMESIQWAAPQQETYQNNDMYFYLLLQLFSQDNNN